MERANHTASSPAPPPRVALSSGWEDRVKLNDQIWGREQRQGLLCPACPRCQGTMVPMGFPCFQSQGTQYQALLPCLLYLGAVTW